jgi:hypothetical protein
MVVMAMVTHEEIERLERQIADIMHRIALNEIVAQALWTQLIEFRARLIVARHQLQENGE